MVGKPWAQQTPTCSGSAQPPPPPALETGLPSPAFFSLIMTPSFPALLRRWQRISFLTAADAKQQRALLLRDCRVLLRSALSLLFLFSTHIATCLPTRSHHYDVAAEFRCRPIPETHGLWCVLRGGTDGDAHPSPVPLPPPIGEPLVQAAHSQGDPREVPLHVAYSNGVEPSESQEHGSACDGPTQQQGSDSPTLLLPPHAQPPEFTCADAAVDAAGCAGGVPGRLTDHLPLSANASSEPKECVESEWAAPAGDAVIDEPDAGTTCCAPALWQGLSHASSHLESPSPRMRIAGGSKLTPPSTPTSHTPLSRSALRDRSPRSPNPRSPGVAGVAGVAGGGIARLRSATPSKKGAGGGGVGGGGSRSAASSQRREPARICLVLQVSVFVLLY
jgi:hypothetical protein